MLWFIIVLAVIGLVAGFLARALVPGDDSMSIAMTIAIGVIGSFVGGFIGWALFGKDFDEGAVQPSGLIGSVVGAILVLLAHRALTSRGSHRGRHLVG